MGGGGDSVASPLRDTFKNRLSHVTLRGSHFKRIIVVILLLLFLLLLRIIDSVKIEGTWLLRRNNVPKTRETPDGIPINIMTDIPFIQRDTAHLHHQQVGSPVISKKRGVYEASGEVIQTKGRTSIVSRNFPS